MINRYDFIKSHGMRKRMQLSLSAKSNQARPTPMDKKPISIRPAEQKDAEECSNLFCASIRELCVKDHGGKDELITGWTANKTPEDIRGWIQNGSPQLFVAHMDGQLAAVGGITLPMEVSLNYVSPNAVGCGVGKAMLQRLEQELKRQGAPEATLVSTRTARAFYESQGWEATGDAQACYTVDGFPMRKLL